MTPPGVTYRAYAQLGLATIVGPHGFTELIMGENHARAIATIFGIPFTKVNGR